MTRPIMTDAEPDRREVFAAINAGIDAGLPMPQGVSFSSSFPIINFDNVADLRQWAAWFGHGEVPVTLGQPYPNLADPAQSGEWLTNLCMTWRGDYLVLKSSDPILVKQRQHWIDSGAAARHADRLDAKTKAAS